MAKTIIPFRLQKDIFAFVKLEGHTKKAFEYNWPNKPYSYKDIQSWIDQGNNYGVIGGYGDLIIIDADTLELFDIIQERLPLTFTIKSSRFAYHHYFICKEIKSKTIVLKKDNIPHGEIRSHGSQTVGPGSIHPEEGTRYRVVKDIEIAEVTQEQVYSALNEYIAKDMAKEDIEVDRGEIVADSSGINIIDILKQKNIFARQVGEQLVCSHPIHGSTNHNNFVVNPQKNVWHCFRCHSGGGALSLIAVLEGIVPCQEAVSGGLRGNKFLEAKRIAQEKYGFIIEQEAEKPNINLNEDKLTALEEKIKLIPKDSPALKLPQLLEPLLKEMAELSIIEANVLLKHTVKEHFKFTNDDLKSYEKVLEDYRKKAKNNEIKKSLNKIELLEILSHEEANKVIHPAQDYNDGLMSFSVKVKDEIFLLVSDKRLFNLNDAVKEGFILKYDTVDLTRFSAKGIGFFLEGKYEINIQELYQKIYGYIKRFICFPDEAYLTYATLWVMGTYVFMLFRYYPYVWLNAEKGSGKTLLMEILSSIAFNAELITNPTESVIFRDISNNLITMFIDEVEQLRKRDKDTYGSVISLLNAGFNKAGVVKRTESTSKGSFVVKAYTAYSPKMFAGINEIDDILQDRTVRIPLLRKKDNETVQRYKETPEIIELQRSIRDDLYVFALTYAKEIAENYHKLDPEILKNMSHLNNRELDIWEPIFLLANLVDTYSHNKNLTTAMEALIRKSLEEKQSDNISQNETYKLLTVLKAMLDELTPLNDGTETKVFEAARVLEYFKATEDFDWIEKTNLLTRRLKRVKVVSEQRRLDFEKKRVYIVNLKDFADLCERFKIE
ncbi:MAG: DUF3631 domain-containing protein [Candidatus Omnitrophica bacterium]|nr:DUF3631 domain-containing protein [Candidatus Omnitrophota bacterium]